MRLVFEGRDSEGAPHHLTMVRARFILLGLGWPGGLCRRFFL